MQILPRCSTLLALLALVLAACADSSAPIVPAPITAADLAGQWRMQSFSGKTVPAAYAVFPDEPTDEGPKDVVIRLDSARMTLTAAGKYSIRQYCFTELHDDVPRFKYCWGDHGSFTLSDEDDGIDLVSEFIQNLFATGTVNSKTSLAMTEELWHSEAKLPTVWAKTP